MNRPKQQSLETALEAAERMWRSEVDPHHLAESLRYLHQRNEKLDVLLASIDHFLRFGMTDPDLVKLRKIVNELRRDGEFGESEQPQVSEILPI